MSGIYGFALAAGEPADPGQLARMDAALAHRGPDGAGSWLEGSVAFGCRLFRTTPESIHERLPALSDDGSLVLTADARIDNRDEILATLGLADRARDGFGDDRLILAAYEKWGQACPERLIGDFAFVIRDARRGLLFCARDTMGVRPFCYHASTRGFAFASEIGGLLALPWVPRRLNELRIADHLVPQFEDATNTFYRDIARLPPAHSLTVRKGAIRLRRYWRLDPRREIRMASDDAYAEAFRHHFTEAVRCRLRANGPVGALLSGGLDSSAITCTARSVLQGTGSSLHTFSAVFPSLHSADPRIDEDRYIAAVVALGGIEPHFVQADRASPLSDFLWKGDEAIPAPNLYMDLTLMDAAREAGTRVLLSGWDGDSTVSHGLEYLGQLARTGRWLALRREARALANRLAAKSVTTRKVMWQFGFRQMAPDFAVRAWRRARGRPVHGLVGPINPGFASRIRLDDRIRNLGDVGPIPLRSARTLHARSLGSGLLVYGLELLDKAAATAFIEQRYPFCDRRLVEFCVGLPAGQKLRDGWSRSVLRRAMAPLFPQTVAERVRKGNLSANFKRRFLADGRETMEEVLAASDGLIGDYVDVPALKAAYARYAAEPLKNEQDALAVLLGVTLALWLREHPIR